MKDGSVFARLSNISVEDAELAGKLRGKYRSLKALDALRIAVAINLGVDVFLTNDLKLGSIEEIQTLILKNYLN